MTEATIFGTPLPGVSYTPRRAAYVVVFNGAGEVAVVAGREKYFLPGGGSLAGEEPEETVAREVREELALAVKLTHRLGVATQYFYSAMDELHYEMLAVFFAGEFTGEAATGDAVPEQELYWLPVSETEDACFHACHAWAARLR